MSLSKASEVDEQLWYRHSDPRNYRGGSQRHDGVYKTGFYSGASRTALQTPRLVFRVGLRCVTLSRLLGLGITVGDESTNALVRFVGHALSFFFRQTFEVALDD